MFTRCREVALAKKCEALRNLKITQIPCETEHYYFCVWFFWSFGDKWTCNFSKVSIDGSSTLIFSAWWAPNACKRSNFLKVSNSSSFNNFNILVSILQQQKLARLRSKVGLVAIFVVQKTAAPKNGVEFCQKSIGAIRCSAATSCRDVSHHATFVSLLTNEKFWCVGGCVGWWW